MDLTDWPVIDLFSGAGGFSLGFQQAGFPIKYGIDIWKKVGDTFRTNHPQAEFINADMLEVDPAEFVGKVKIVIGSPPCTKFSMINKNRNPEEGMELVYAFLHFIDVIHPQYWILENVPQIYDFIPAGISKHIYCAADYGVPQKRHRCFAGKFASPFPTHNETENTTLEGVHLLPWVRMVDALPGHFLPTDMINDLTSVDESSFHSVLEPARTVRSVIPLVISQENYVEWKTTHATKRPHPTRALTVQEMTALQGFPPTFEWKAGKADTVKMIGNAVSPDMSYALALSLLHKIKKQGSASPLLDHSVLPPVLFYNKQTTLLF